MHQSLSARPPLLLTPTPELIVLRPHLLVCQPWARAEMPVCRVGRAQFPSAWYAPQALFELPPGLEAS